MKDIKIGWLGTGVMGTPMIKHFLDAGFEVSIFSRTRSRAESLEENGAIWKDSPAQLAQDVEIIFSMLGYPSDVESVLLGKNGVIKGIQGGTILIDMTTSSPELAKKMNWK